MGAAAGGAPGARARGRAEWAASALVGTQAGWALQSALATPLLLRLGAPAAALAWLRLLGPAAGLLVQPAVGVASDWAGRRRPFLALGAGLAALGLAAMALAETRGSIEIAFAGLWLLDIGFNSADAAARALVADSGGATRQTRLQSVVAGALSLGQILGYSLAAFAGAGRGAGASALCAPALWAGAALTMVTLVLALVLGPRDEVRRGSFEADAGAVVGARDAAPLLPGEASQASDSPLRKRSPPLRARLASFPGAWRVPPRWMLRLCAVNGVLWAGWFFLLLFGAHWVGRDVFAGDPRAPEGSRSAAEYEKGVRWASGGLVGAAVVTLAAAAGVAPAARHLGLLERTHALGGGLLLGCCLMGSLAVKPGQRAAAVAVLVATGVPWAVTQSVPYAVVAARAGPDERGRLLGLLNVFIVLPQLADLLFVRLAGAAPVRALLAGGAGCAFAAAALGTVLPAPNGGTPAGGGGDRPGVTGHATARS